jgi:broad specificity phosphatase PhoE
MNEGVVCTIMHTVIIGRLFEHSKMNRQITVHLIRHGQGYHNEGAENRDHTLRDPSLTPVGEEQCTNLNKRIVTDGLAVDLILVSPFRRTLQTCQHVFKHMEHSYKNGKTKILMCPLAGEHCFGAPADHGSDISVLRNHLWTFPYEFDDNVLPAEWWKHGRNAHETMETFEQRVHELQRCICETARVHSSVTSIAVVSHGGVLSRLHHLLTNKEEAKRDFDNCELRTVVVRQMVPT